LRSHGRVAAGDAGSARSCSSPTTAASAPLPDHTASRPSAPAPLALAMTSSGTCTANQKASFTNASRARPSTKNANRR
jgi:hypothetical protein